MPPVSIRDVAMRAGVSVGTVSNVLNRPNLVAEATRERVRAAIGELGFVRNESARQLRQGRSRTLGVVVESLGNPYFTDLARGAEAAMNTDGFDALWCTSDGSAAKERRCLDFLEEQRVSGVIITPVGLDAGRIAELRDRGLSVVVLDRRAYDGVCSIRVDHVAGGEIAVDHLTSRHRRLAIVTGPLVAEPITDRYEGAVAAARRAGVAEEHLTTLVQGDLTPTSGMEAARRLLELDPLPTGVFCANDLLAIGLVNALLRTGVKVPEEISVVGYDDIELAGTSVVPLTTVRQPRHELGWTAAELAVAEAGTAEGHEHRGLALSPSLVVRESA
ncbi:LacI family DNA-binding transcriptional regulator [Actinoallomurus iriomotensis]|uniref:LacI family transcriptional regulator n=1 Tax=Actinoallomurus iriomotensis TaxID=478107 RepID=A0A9W6RPW7_9ACTN|nr:LacI family transcriptional regulator [Actinoallomurus iriomotensis]